ncbi:hypothetical protein ACFWAY_48405 [Rhodococcus sp. NPDC059968]|uniref:hypothetical protein n=1 Tax=Rhodococcus sp. NPDC059968 TaxID=3347017 RepID=UPI003672408F
MGPRRLVLDLYPPHPPRDLLDIAATELTERGTRGRTTLELRTTGPTGTADRRP